MHIKCLTHGEVTAVIVILAHAAPHSRGIAWARRRPEKLRAVLVSGPV